ncbi:hypothetical protein BKI52_05285 [marine bacterium AO1-C]|nr:hypothetical protein BKI52_05285 [marine bacterium AO1-C]
MPKNDSSLHKVCIAAIQRHTMLDFAHEFKYSSYYPEPSHFAEEVATELTITLHNEELCICSTIVDAQNWSVLTTQRIITCIAGGTQQGNIIEAVDRKLGHFKDKENATIFGHIILKSGLEIPFFIETRKASMIMIQGVLTVIQRSTCTDEQNEKVARIWNRKSI